MTSHNGFQQTRQGLTLKLIEVHPQPHFEVAEAEFSLEELSQSYAQVLGTNDSDAAEIEIFAEDVADREADETNANEALLADSQAVTPQSIVEALLFVGRPENAAISAKEIAAIMRGVTEEEVVEVIARLNCEYEAAGQVMRICEAADGFRMELATELEFIRDRFYGRVSEVSLNQAAIDCLALIAYQPGISREQLEQQRGQASGPLLNQLVRRQLIEMRRVSLAESNGRSADSEMTNTTSARAGKRASKVACYYPTDKLVQLAGLGSLEDLPQVEDLELS